MDQKVTRMINMVAVSGFIIIYVLLVAGMTDAQSFFTDTYQFRLKNIQILIDNKQYSKSVDLIESLKIDFPDRPEIYLVDVKLTAALFEGERGMDILDEIESRGWTGEPYYFYRTVTLYRQERFTESVAVAVAGIELYPDYYPLYFMAAMNYYFLDDLDTGRSFLYKAIELDRSFSTDMFFEDTDKKMMDMNLRTLEGCYYHGCPKISFN